jgi:uncharacterized protein (TIGR01732 family)
MELNVSNVNAASFQTPYMAPQPTYTAPSYDFTPSYGYGCPEPCNDNTFVLVVVLFILLIIIGACYFPKC